MPTNPLQTNVFEYPKYEPKNQSIQLLVADWKRKYENEFNTIKKLWVPKIRDFLNKSTGLSLHQNNNRRVEPNTNLNFYYVPDFNGKFLKLIDETFPDLDFNELMANRHLQLSMNNAENFYQKPNKPTNEFKTLLLHINIYLVLNDIENVVNRLFNSKESDEDIFGSYTYRSGRIDLYYVPLLLFSRLKELSLADCLLVVLVHEAAHAYHHAGKDNDQQTWENMPTVNNFVKEGLAQYYTWLFTENYKDTYPGVKKAYEAILACQEGPYIVHTNWINNYKIEHVKFALTAVRRNKSTEIKEFIALLEKGKETLK